MRDWLGALSWLRVIDESQHLCCEREAPQIEKFWRLHTLEPRGFSPLFHTITPGAL